MNWIERPRTTNLTWTLTECAERSPNFSILEMEYVKRRVCVRFEHNEILPNRGKPYGCSQVLPRKEHLAQ